MLSTKRLWAVLSVLLLTTTAVVAQAGPVPLELLSDTVNSGRGLARLANIIRSEDERFWLKQFLSYPVRGRPVFAEAEIVNALRSPETARRALDQALTLARSDESLARWAEQLIGNRLGFNHLAETLVHDRDVAAALPPTDGALVRSPFTETGTARPAARTWSLDASVTGVNPLNTAETHWVTVAESPSVPIFPPEHGVPVPSTPDPVKIPVITPAHGFLMSPLRVEVTAMDEVPGDLAAPMWFNDQFMLENTSLGAELSDFTIRGGGVLNRFLSFPTLLRAGYIEPHGNTAYVVTQRRNGVQLLSRIDLASGELFSSWTLDRDIAPDGTGGNGRIQSVEVKGDSVYFVVKNSPSPGRPSPAPFEVWTVKIANQRLALPRRLYQTSERVDGIHAGDDGKLYVGSATPNPDYNDFSRGHIVVLDPTSSAQDPRVREYTIPGSTRMWPMSNIVSQGNLVFFSITGTSALYVLDERADTVAELKFYQQPLAQIIKGLRVVSNGVLEILEVTEDGRLNVVRLNFKPQ